MTECNESRRFHALDQLRATAMLLGVFYHALLFSNLISGGIPGRFGPAGSRDGFDGSMMMQEWLHSFRMPLFFLISGFFCRMMFQKYGIWKYLVRRWWRIGAPLLIGLFTFVPMYHLASDGFRAGPSMGGPSRNGLPMDRAPMGGLPFNFDDLPPPPPGFVPPPLIPFDKNQDGSIDDEEWQAVRKSFAARLPQNEGQTSGSIDASKTDDEHSNVKINKDPEGIASSADGRSPVEGRTLRGTVGLPPMPPGGPGGMFGPPGDVSAFVFGSNVRLFTLSHLWFLWYLFVFATGSPFLAATVDWLLRWRGRTAIDRLAVSAFRWQLMPLLFGLFSLPALLLTPSFFGWSLGFAAGIGRGFPDFLWHLEIDMPFYLTYFLTGWFLHRMRDELPDVAAGWWINLAIGMSLFIVAGQLSRTYSIQTSLPHYGIVRILGYGVYAVSAAYVTWGFLGGFQRYADRPSLIGGYLADTAFWVYLVHQALLFPFLAWLAPFKLDWWINGILATTMTTVAALLIFESVVRPTPLFDLFGPGRSRRSKPEITDTGETPLIHDQLRVQPI
jgi:hypothetical protein